MIDPNVLAFVRRALYLACALSLGGYAATLAVSTQAAAIWAGAAAAFICFANDWQIEGLRNKLIKLAGYSKRGDEALRAIAEICADHFEGARS